MRINKRLERIEQMLHVDECDLCGPAGVYSTALWPNGFGVAPRLTLHGDEFPDNCPRCGRALFSSDRCVKSWGGIHPNDI